MKKIYKISYGKYFNYIFSQIFLCFNNIFTFLIIAVSMIWLQGTLESAFGKDNTLIEIITTLIVISIIILSVVLLIFTFVPKKVILYDNYITIKRYMLNFEYLFRGFNDNIYIENIVECKIYDGERYLLHRAGPYAVYFFDWNDLVEIKTGKLGKHRTYLVPVKNSKEFVDEVNSRIVAE